MIKMAIKVLDSGKAFPKAPIKKSTYNEKIIRTKKNIQDNSYTLLNNTLDIKLTINESSYDLITNATNSNGKISPFLLFYSNCRSFFKELTNLGVLVDNGIANPLYINCVQDSSILPFNFFKYRTDTFM